MGGKRGYRLGQDAVGVALRVVGLIGQGAVIAEVHDDIETAAGNDGRIDPARCRDRRVIADAAQKMTGEKAGGPCDEDGISGQNPGIPFDFMNILPVLGRLPVVFTCRP